MAEKTVAEKARVKPGVAVATINAVQPVVAALGLPGDTRIVAPDVADIVLLFANTKAEFDELFAPAVAALKPGAAIWVFFRKGSKGAGLDMNRDTIWYAAEQLDMRPLGIVGIDETWSAFRLRPGT